MLIHFHTDSENEVWVVHDARTQKGMSAFTNTRLPPIDAAQRRVRVERSI